MLTILQATRPRPLPSNTVTTDHHVKTWFCALKLRCFIISSKPVLKFISQFKRHVFSVTHSDRKACESQNITAWSGTFQSPNYAFPYPSDGDCYWLLQVSDGNLIEITFQDFSVGFKIVLVLIDWTESEKIRKEGNLNIARSEHRVNSQGWLSNWFFETSISTSADSKMISRFPAKNTC